MIYLPIILIPFRITYGKTYHFQFVFTVKRKINKFAIADENIVNYKHLNVFYLQPLK